MGKFPTSAGGAKIRVNRGGNQSATPALWIASGGVGGGRTAVEEFVDAVTWKWSARTFYEGDDLHLITDVCHG